MCCQAIFWLLVHLVLDLEPTITAHHDHFAIQPESVVQAEGLEAVFECLYSGVDLLGYGWALNGSFLSVLPAGVAVILPLEHSPSTRLILPATLQYNNTVVQCEAVLRVEGVLTSFQSENATLVRYQY